MIARVKEGRSALVWVDKRSPAENFYHLMPGDIVFFMIKNSELESRVLTRFGDSWIYLGYENEIFEEL